jgi:DNA-binding GntR family transcriptional regulator
MPTLADIPPLPTLSGAPRHLSEAIADAITSAIAQGALHPGERLFEEAIAAQLSVSRVPLREAIRTLEAQGILVVTPNRGARVVSMDERTVANVQEARIALERIACKGVMKRIDKVPRLLDAMQDATDSMRSAKRRLDWAGLRRCDIQFHRALCAAAENEVVAKLWEGLSRHIAIIFGREIEQEHDFDVVIAQHELLLAMLARKDRGVAKEIEAHIMRLSRRPDMPESS